MSKILAFFSLTVFSFSVFAGSPKLDNPIKNIVKEYKKGGCSMSSNAVTYAFNSDETELVLAVPFEGCGGGNNWGFDVAHYKNFDGKKWTSKKAILVSSVEKISYQNDHFLIEYMDYADEDPRCCPSKHMKKIVK